MRLINIFFLLFISISIQAQDYCFSFGDWADDFINDKITDEFKLLVKDDNLGADYMSAWNYLKRGGFDFDTRTNPDLIKQLQTDVANPKYNLKEFFESDPDEILIWKELKDDPFYSGELIKETSDPLWLKWKDREFFKAITKKGTDFENKVLNAVKTRTGKEYEKLKELIPDIDQRKLISQMQFCVPGKSPPCNAKGDYFIADQVWIKYDNRGRVRDMIVVDAKLSESTALTSGQTKAKNQVGKGSLAYKPANFKEFDELNNRLPTKISQGDVIPINGFYKLYGDGTGNFVNIK